MGGRPKQQRTIDSHREAAHRIVERIDSDPITREVIERETALIRATWTEDEERKRLVGGRRSAEWTVPEVGLSLED